MSDIKVGDLVMIVKQTACCGSGRHLGEIFKVCDIRIAAVGCSNCGSISESYFAKDDRDGLWCHFCRLTKIDPPAEGDSLPTRADLEVTA